MLTSQRVARIDALHTVQQKISSDAANPLVYNGQQLIPGVTRTFSASRPLFVFFQSYERDAVTMRPLVAYVTFYGRGVKAFESESLAVRDGWNPTSKAVPIRFTVPLGPLQPGSYDCQVTVLDPDGGRAAFWRAPIVVNR